MIHRVYTIFDSKAGMYALPFFDHSDASAKRRFLDMAMRSDTLIGVHPEDFCLFWIGLYDDEDARVEAGATLVSLGLASELLAANGRIRRFDPSGEPVSEEVEALREGIRAGNAEQAELRKQQDDTAARLEEKK